VLSIEADDAVVEERLKGRRFCPNCNAAYHTESRPPKQDGICDVCGTALATRKDDEPETVVNRLKSYHKDTAPLKEYYKKQGKLKTVESLPGIEKSTAAVYQVLGI